MTDTQVIFRVDNKLLKKLDKSISQAGFKTRNEWFRNAIRNYLEEVERKRALKDIQKLKVEDVSEEEILEMVKTWRKKKGATK